MKKFTHIDKEGKSRVVDVSEKAATVREAVARGFVSMKPDTVQMILDSTIPR